MKILFCTPCELHRELGKSKIMIELGEALSRKGWECDFLGKNETLKLGKSSDYNSALKTCLESMANNYDVIEFEHDQIDFPKITRPHTLFVARVSLLAFHYLEIRLPHFSTWKDKVRLLVKNDPFWGPHVQLHCDRVRKVCLSVDLINVANRLDTEALIRQGVPKEKIVKIPYGLSESRLKELESFSKCPGPDPVVVWIGTFDQRKGAVDLAEIIPKVMEKQPRTKWRLLGTAGVFQNKEEVYKRLPSRYHAAIEVIPRYDSNSLLDYLKDGSVGVFPSYIESFGFAVLEMMSAGLPVAAYYSPGPQEMLPEKMLVQPGDKNGIAQLLNLYLEDLPRRENDGAECKKRALEFTWKKAADFTEESYQRALELKKT